MTPRVAVALLVAPLAIAPAQAALRLVAEAPCSVFQVGEELRFRAVEGSLDGIALRVVDLDETAVWEAVGAGDAVTVAPTGAGWFELRWEGGATTFGVVPAREHAAAPDGSVSVDAAMAWLSGPEQWAPLGAMLRRIGVGRVRERLSWGGVEKEKGTIDWERYAVVADALNDAGVREYQIFHDSPGWTHPGSDTRAPEDLRDVYRFTREAARAFRGRIDVWEPWNEPDIGFFDRLSDRMAGIQKAAWLGFHAGDPEAKVLQVSLCRGRCNFSDALYECGIADYVDGYNFHTYDDISRYRETIDHWVEMANDYGIGDRPIWLSEAGIRTPFTEPEKELSLEAERKQAAFVPKSYAISLSAGVDKHFFFVLPYYPENDIQFGILHRDLTPRPALLALATCARLLGDAPYRRRLTGLAGGVEAYLFGDGPGRTVVLWAEAADAARLAVGPDASLVDYLGRSRPLEADAAGVATVWPSSTPVFVTGIAESADLGPIEPPARQPGQFPTLAPSPVVICGRFESLAVDKGGDWTRVPLNERAEYVVEVVNLTEERAAAGTVHVSFPEGWSPATSAHEVSLEPMGRALLRIPVTPGGVRPFPRAVVTVTAEFPGERVAPSVSHVSLDLATAEPRTTQALPSEEPAEWRPNVSGNGTVAIEPGAEGGVAFRIRFAGEGDRWAYPLLALEPPADWSAFDGLRLEYRTSVADDAIPVRLQLAEKSGSMYCSPTNPSSTEWRKVMVPFQDLQWGTYSPVDPNGRLDLDAIATLVIGVNTPRDGEIVLEVRNLELVSL